MNSKIEPLRVCSKQCDECLYTKNKIVSDDRREEILNTLRVKNDFFICHKSTIVGQKVMCKGYYNRHKLTSLLIRLGLSLGLIKFVDINKLRRKR